MNTDNSFELLPPAALAAVAEANGITKTLKHPLHTFLLAIMAGVFISIGFTFYVTATTGIDALPYGLGRLAGGIAFSLGLMLVIVCGAELFTSAVLTVVAKASGKITLGQLARHWLNVYAGNLAGALLFVCLIWLSGQHLVAGGRWGANVLQIADHKLSYSFSQALCLGILANLMVCLAVWMSYAGRTLTDKLLVMILPVTMFVVCGFEHSIANLFMVPLAIVIKTFATPEFWQLSGLTAKQFSSLTPEQFLVNNLIPVTLGNIFGGALLVGLTNWFIYRRNGPVNH